MIGWTVDKWREHQLSEGPDGALATLKNLAKTLREDWEKHQTPEWIAVASSRNLEDQWTALDHTKASELPLYGVPFAVKDNIDVQGFDTTAACPAFTYSPTADAFVVARLRSAGAVVIGKTNLDQFATGLVGVRTPYGICSSVFSEKHVSGGSSSGSAVAVGKGLVPFSLGTDTAGSGRVPAALNNLIGVKPTVGVWSQTGLVPACKSLDTISIFTLTVRDAQKIFKIGAAYDDRCEYSRALPELPLASFGRRPILGAPNKLEFFGDEDNASLFKEAVNRLTAAGVEVQFVDCSNLFRLAKLLYEGPWVAERYHAVSKMLERPEEMDPTVYKIIKGAESHSAVDVFAAEYLRQKIKQEVSTNLGHLDGFVMPTCPLNPLIEDVLKNPVAINSQQGTYTNFVNLGDFSALAVPNGFRPDGLPQGVTLMSWAFNDYALLDLAQRYLALMPKRLLGNTGVLATESDDVIATADRTPPRTHRLAVVGAHLSGMVLNWQLRKVGATLAERTKTSPNYRLYALNTQPPKPGLSRVESNGVSIALEVWDVPYNTLGEFLAMVPPPLGLGSVELESGEYVHGFICEAYALRNARDITEFGGWRSYIAATSKALPFTKVLVANRGEIAVRAMRTLRRLGIKSVAVYSSLDAQAQHVQDADEAVDLRGTTAAETYLSIRKIIDACKATAAQAVFPGYGFLSENADFADMCDSEGIIFIGPSGKAMRQLGLKHAARELAARADVPLVPGSGLVDTIDEALASAKKLGYPVMVKSSAGGGGIGLQRVDSDEELRSAFVSVRRQGEAYFGDSSIFLETFVENARHVEVQVVGDGRGDAIALGERDCSLQRRNQKIIEETPAPGLSGPLRSALRRAGRNLAASMNYKGAATVEFIYDSSREQFYFLEVNARLQVEHPITEMVTGVDLVEWMILVAADRPPSFDIEYPLSGASMEARLYAENPVKDFAPSSGQITELKFPDWCRVDTWITKGTVVSSEYDPTIGKIIVHGKDRNDALEKLLKALDETVVAGVNTNIDYLRAIASSQMFRMAKMYTKVLDTFEYKPNAVEVLSPGPSTTIQDYPGRVCYWNVGVPPSGPMDDFAHRVANNIVGNHESSPVLEASLAGPTLLFHQDSVVAVTGGSCVVTVDGAAVDQWVPLSIRSGQKLQVGKLVTGCRAYIAIRGGLNVPEYLNSRSTFVQGKIGGLNGRALRFGDVLLLGSPNVASCTLKEPTHAPITYPKELVPTYGKEWNIAVTYGPHGSPDFFAPNFVEEFFASDWKVHYNSNRFGVRLVGPKPTWARAEGGEGGLHPSNTHDYVYSMGAINFTGDEPVILTRDGPSLGGFVCLAVIVKADLWKIGQVKPGDIIRFIAVSVDDAHALRDTMDQRIKGANIPLTALSHKVGDAVLSHGSTSGSIPEYTYRQAGDRCILVEYGEGSMDLNLRYRVHKLSEELAKVPGVVELSPGVRSVNIEYEPRQISQNDLLAVMLKIEHALVYSTGWKVPSRVVRLPMAFEDSQTLAAVKRYEETIRSSAPWLPNNVDFVQRVNALRSRSDVRNLMYTARFMVLGLGDVYLGAPCAVPLDPRQQLLGTKYNPSRSWTPNGCVGLGGMYMCIYTMESPGGYQLVGRTIPIWDKLCLNPSTVADKPWLLRSFDIIEFFPVSESELNEASERVQVGRYTIEITDTEFDMNEYCEFLKANAASITEHKRKQELLKEEFAATVESATLETDTETVTITTSGTYSENAHIVYADITGRFWKSLVKEGENVEASSPILVLEAMKTEIAVSAPAAGRLVKVCHRNGDMVEAGDVVAIIEP